MDAPSQPKKRRNSPDAGPAEPDPDGKASEEAMPAELISAGSQQLHRKLGGKEIQLFAVGGAIGTCMSDTTSSWMKLTIECPALYVQMGASLPKGGPAGLFLGFVLYGTLVLAVNECFGEFIDKDSG